MKNLKDISIFVIGTGSIGRRHITNLSSLVKKVNVFSYRKINSINGLKNISFMDDINKGIDESDALVIANRTDQHVETAIKGAAKNKFIFIEKPLSNSLKKLNILKEITEKNKKEIETGFMLRFHPNLLELKQIIKLNNFGQVHYVRASVGQYLPDWRPNQDYRQGYGALKKWGGGVTLDLIHEIDLVLWLFGEVDYLSAQLGYTPNLEIETESISQINLKMKSGIPIQLHLDYLRPSYGRFTEIVTEKGTISWDYLSGKLFFEDSKGYKKVIHEVNDNFTRNKMYIDEMKHFINTIEGNSENLASNFYDGECALRIALSAHLSYKTKKFISPNDIKEDYTP